MKASQIMQAMLDAGAPVEAAMIALRALEERDAEIERRRAGDRERKRRQRAKEADDNVNVTGQSRDSHSDIPGHVTDTPLSLSPNENNSNPHTHTPGDITPRARKATGFVLPSHIPAEQWEGFVAMRRKIGHPLSPRAMSLAIAELDKLAADGWPPGDVLDQSTLNGWRGLFGIKDKGNGRSGQNIGSNSRDRRDGVARALDRQLGLDDLPLDGRPTGGGGNDRSCPVAYLAAVR